MPPRRTGPSPRPAPSRNRQPAAGAEAGPVSQERARFLEEMAEIRDAVNAVEAKVEQMPDQEAERRAEVEEAGIDEPVVHEPQAEPELESAWQPGEAVDHSTAEAEAEIEM